MSQNEALDGPVEEATARGAHTVDTGTESKAGASIDATNSHRRLGVEEYSANIVTERGIARDVFSGYFNAEMVSVSGVTSATVITVSNNVSALEG